MKIFVIKYAIGTEHIITGIFADSYEEVFGVLKKENKEIQILETWESEINE